MNVQAIVKRMFHTKPSKIVGVDIGTGSIKMVQIETGSKPVVSCFAVAELPLELINNGFVRNSDAMISFIKGLVAKYDFNARHAVHLTCSAFPIHFSHESPARYQLMY